jgi:L-ascorbate metabolism protein UlaG (beta-lactamase superfamily)
VLIDPWFVGGQSDVARWFSQQFHATPSAVKSVAEVEELARQVEILAGGLRLGSGRKRKAEDLDEESYVDCVAISHEFTDHCHKETLLEVHKDVPVFATEVRSNEIALRRQVNWLTICLSKQPILYPPGTTSAP